MKKIRVLIADDHAFLRMGLRSMLVEEPDMEVAGEACDGEEVVRLYDRLNPDVVIMDLMMPKQNGAEATGQIRREHPDARIIVLTSFGNSADLLRALDNGAVGALMKESPTGELADAIRRVMSGETAIAPEIRELRKDAPEPASLTDKQTEILQSVLRGFSNKDIAKQFGISEPGVKKHLKLIFAKLGAATRAEAVGIALRKRLLKV